MCELSKNICSSSNLRFFKLFLLSIILEQSSVSAFFQLFRNWKHVVGQVHYDKEITEQFTQLPYFMSSQTNKIDLEPLQRE